MLLWPKRGEGRSGQGGFTAGNGPSGGGNLPSAPREREARSRERACSAQSRFGSAWVQDWGVASVAQPGRELGGNIMVGITSYGPVSLTPRYQGSSILNNEWVTILNLACAQPRACS